MSSAPLERLKELFHSARELPPREREAFLTGACGSDEQLRQEIEALLESDLAVDDFIADPPARLVADAFGGSPAPSEAGRMIGQYKLLECIGSGGMGAVYLAERADQQSNFASRGVSVWRQRRVLMSAWGVAPGF